MDGNMFLRSLHCERYDGSQQFQIYSLCFLYCSNVTEDPYSQNSILPCHMDLSKHCRTYGNQ
jgi:hypothetical protein